MSELAIYHSPRRCIRSQKEIACEMDSQSYSYELDGLAIKPANPLTGLSRAAMSDD